MKIRKKHFDSAMRNLCARVWQLAGLSTVIGSIVMGPIFVDNSITNDLSSAVIVFFYTK